MNKTRMEWKVASTNAFIKPEFPNNSFGTTDISLAELAMREVNKFFENLGKSENELMQDFEQNRGDAFERFYGTTDARSSKNSN